MRQWPDRSWAVENARGLGRHLAQWLLARGEQVQDVPATATTRVRELSRGGRRKNDVLAAQRTRLVNQLHALLRDLLPGGAPTQLTADQAAELLRPIRPVGVVERTRKDLARDMIVELRGIDARLKASAAYLASSSRPPAARSPRWTVSARSWPPA